MLQLTTLLRSLGNAGAVANAQAVLEDRRREDWVIEGLARRIAPAPLPATLPAQPAAAVA